MRSLVHFRIAPNGRVTITSAPAVGQETIFSEGFLTERVSVELPGRVTFPGNWPLPPGSIITVTPDQGAAMTFRVDSIGPYSPPEHVNVVVFATRLT